METQITVKIKPEEKALLLEASKIASMGHSTFCRSAAMQKAREILNANKSEEPKDV